MGTHRRIPRCFALLLVPLAAPALADEPDPAAPAKPPNAEARGVPAPEAARAAAKAWLVALRDNRLERLTPASAFPLKIEGIVARGASAKKCRSSSTVKDAAALKVTSPCLFEDKVLLDTLPMDFALAEWKAIEPSAAPKVLGKGREQLAALAKDHAFVQVVANGEGLVYTIVLAVRPAGTGLGVDVVLAASEKTD